MNPFDCLIAPILRAYPELTDADVLFNPPPDYKLGDVAVPMFLPAKKYKMPPPKLAAEAKDKIAFGPEVTGIETAGPYLNLKVNRNYFTRVITTAVLEEGRRFGAGTTGVGYNALIEHTSINPNASPHVGRARNAMIGDSMARLLRFTGYETEVHYYVNDMGRQIGLLVLEAERLENLSFDEILDAYVQANQRAEDDPGFAQQGYALLAKMEEGDEKAKEQFRRVTDLCLEGQLAVLERIGTTYDVFDRESDYVRDPRLDKVLEALRDRGALFTDEHDRQVVDLQQIGWQSEEGRYFVIMRANGSSMYGYRDLAYTIDKESKDTDVNLIVLGEDHKMYFEQLGTILEAAGHSTPEPVYYSYILLKAGKMSTREGKVVLLSEFLDQAQALAAERVAEQCHELSAEEQQAIAGQVAVAAIRFAVLRVSPNKNVTFDLDAALSFTGDTGPYIQYSCARISSILRKYEGDLHAPPSTDFPAHSDAEWNLLTKLAEFPRVVSMALGQRTVTPVATFALEVARAFTTFYHDCPVLTAERPAQIRARAQICQATRQTLANALHLLGIAAPERM